MSMVAACASVPAQDHHTLSELLSAMGKARLHLWQQGEYESAVAALEAGRALYLAADSNEQRIDVRAFEVLLNEMVQAYTCLNLPARL